MFLSPPVPLTSELDKGRAEVGKRPSKPGRGMAGLGGWKAEGSEVVVQ